MTADVDPWWRELFDPSKLTMASNLTRRAIGPYQYLGALVTLAGEDADGNPNLPATASLITKGQELVTSIRAGRVDKVVEAMKHEEPRHSYPGVEWAPGYHPGAEDNAEEENKPVYSPKGLK